MFSIKCPQLNRGIKYPSQKLHRKMFIYNIILGGSIMREIVYQALLFFAMRARQEVPVEQIHEEVMYLFNIDLKEVTK